MKDDVKDVFAKLVLGLVEKKPVEFKTYLQTGRDDRGFRAEITIPGTAVVVKIEKKTRVETHSEVEPDPRMFGDTAEVTANAMRGWYPGKTNSWTETKTTVRIEVRGLPEIETHEEIYKFTENAFKGDTQKAVERITEIVEEKYREAERNAENKNIAKEADQLRKAFGKI